MGKKYIIELLDDCPSEFKGIIVFGLTPDGQISAEPIPVDDLTPYTDPDLEQVRQKAYKEGVEDGKRICPAPEVCNDMAYQRGLADAWDAVKKLARMDTDTSESITGYFGLHNIMHNLTASEAIEKLKAYEQEKEEQIQVGDEVDDGVANLIVLEINQDGTVSGFDDEGSIIHATPRKKTGRHFPEIAAVLAKMKE